MAASSLQARWEAFLDALRLSREGDEEARAEAGIFEELRDAFLGIGAHGASNLNDQRGRLTVNESWCRDVDARMIRLEEQVKALVPITMLRDMLDPLRQDITQMAGTVKELADSDLELKELHKGLMRERSEQEKERHQLELRALEAKVAEEARLRKEAQQEHEASKRDRGLLAWISKKAHPLLQFVIAVGVLLGLLYGFILWFQAHYK